MSVYACIYIYLEDTNVTAKLAPKVEMATSNGMMTSPALPMTASAKGWMKSKHCKQPLEKYTAVYNSIQWYTRVYNVLQ